MRKKLGVLIMTAALLAGTLSGCTIGDTEVVLDMNDVGRNDVFSINGMDCTKEEARLYLCNYQNIYGYEYGIDLWNHDFGDIPEEETLEYYVKEVTLAELANVFCMNQLAQEQNITLSSEELQLVSQATDEYYETLSKEERKYIGIDKGDLEKFYEKYALAQKFYQSLSEGVNEEVSDDEARVVLMQQIFIKDESTARVVEQKLNNGSDFVSLAGDYNEADSMEVYLSRGVYSEAVDNVVFNMDDNEISGMIKTDAGYYFIKCVDKFVEDMTEANKENIIVQRRKAHFEDVFGSFIKDSDFDLNEKVWDSITVDLSGAITTDDFFKVYEAHFVNAGASK